MHEVGGVETELLLTLNRRPVRILGEEATHVPPRPRFCGVPSTLRASPSQWDMGAGAQGGVWVDSSSSFHLPLAS